MYYGDQCVLYSARYLKPLQGKSKYTEYIYLKLCTAGSNTKSLTRAFDRRLMSKAHPIPPLHYRHRRPHRRHFRHLRYRSRCLVLAAQKKYLCQIDTLIYWAKAHALEVCIFSHTMKPEAVEVRPLLRKITFRKSHQLATLNPSRKRWKNRACSPIECLVLSWLVLTYCGRGKTWARLRKQIVDIVVSDCCSQSVLQHWIRFRSYPKCNRSSAPAHIRYLTFCICWQRLSLSRLLCVLNVRGNAIIYITKNTRFKKRAETKELRFLICWIQNCDRNA